MLPQLNYLENVQVSTIVPSNTFKMEFSKNLCLMSQFTRQGIPVNVDLGL